MRSLFSIFLIVVLSSISVFSQQSADVIKLQHQSDSLYAIGVDFYNAKKYSEAIPYFENTYGIDTLLYEEGHSRRDYSGEWLSSCFYNLGDTVKAETTSIYYFTAPIDRRKTVKCDSLITKGDECVNLGDLDNALKNYFMALEEVRSELGEKHRYNGILLINIAIVYYYIEDYEKMLNYSIEASEIFKAQLGTIHPDYLSALNNIATVYLGVGDYKTAIKYQLDIVEAYKNIYGENHQYYASVLNNLSMMYLDLCDYANALKLLNQVKQIQENTIGIKNTDYVGLLGNISVVYDEMGNFGSAFQYAKRALDLGNELYDIHHPSYITLLINIGQSSAKLGNYQEALSYYEKTFIIEEEANLDHSFAILNNMASIYNDLGNHKKALEYHFMANERGLNTKGENSREYVQSLVNIGATYSNLNDSTSAFLYFNRAKDKIIELTGAEDLLYIAVLSNMASLYADVGNNEKALEYAENAYSAAIELYGENSYRAYFQLQHTASAYSNMEKYQKAEEHYSRAENGIKVFLSDFHPILGELYSNICCHYFNSGKYETSIDYCAKAFYINRNNLINNFSFLTAAERELYWKNNSRVYNRVPQCNNKLLSDTLANRLSYDSELISKGLLLTSEIEFSKIILESGDSLLLEDFETMKNLRYTLDKQYEKQISERTLNCDSLENVANNLEKKLIENCKSYGDFTRSIAIEWKDVQNSLKEKDLAVEFTSFNIADKNDTVVYAALVLDKTMESPQMIPLFTNYELETILKNPLPQNTLQDSINTEQDERGVTMYMLKSKKKDIYETSALYNVLWKPLEKYLDNSERVFFAPSGKLYQIAIEYLPDDEKTNISDKYELYRLSTTRNLAMDYVTKPYKSSSLYGGIYYDLDTTQMKQESERYTTRSTTNFNNLLALQEDTVSRSVRSSVSYLPGTKEETDIIKSQLTKKKIEVNLYQDSVANEESFKALSGKQTNIIHLATHGFYLPFNEEDSKFINPLDRTGLLMSGANVAWTENKLPEGVEDGILTAREISYLDLRGTDLLVLSACQTALGDISSEGVYGLQRGFKKAGVRTIVMSLWSVDDKATQLMMTEFYKNLTNGKSKRESFLAAQNTVKHTKGFERPYYWAAFVLLDGDN